MRNNIYRCLLVLMAAFALQANARDVCVTDSLVVIETSCSIEHDTIWPNNIKNRIDTLLKSDMFKTSTVGLEIYDLTADSVIYAYNEQQLMRPASTMKMIVAVTALDRLGGSYQFKTRLSYTGNVEKCTLKGNIYVKGGMDPCFNTDDMHAFVESVRNLGVDTIKGNICVDLSMKDKDVWGEGWCWDDDNPILSPLLINEENDFMSRFYNKLGENGIVIVGDTLKATTPSVAKEICARFHSMDQILMRMMKKSDNLFAESMFYQLATATGVRNAKASDCSRIVGKLINRLGLKASDYYVADGSGLSLYNYVSPELQVRFLRYAYKNSNIYNHLLTSMPIAGVDGTLSKRMCSGFAKGNVKAKTGTVTGVSALAGYCTAANGHQLCFSIINMGIQKAAVGRNFQDKICEELCKP